MASIVGVSCVVTIGISFAVVSLAGAAVACHPSRHQARSGSGQVTVPTRRVQCFLWIRLNRNCLAQVTDECYRAQRVVRVVLTGQADASGSHFTDELSVGIPAQGYKGSYARKRGEIPILIGLQDRDHMASLRV